METEIFTCKYFKFGRNTTGLNQSHLRNFLACSIKRGIHSSGSEFFYNIQINQGLGKCYQPCSFLVGFTHASILFVQSVFLKNLHTKNGKTV